MATASMMASRMLAAALLSSPAAVLLSSPAAAQNEGNGALVLELPASTRGLGLGNGFVLSSTDPDAIFYNPGLLARPGGASLSLQRYGSSSSILTAATTRPWSNGGLGFGVQVATYGVLSPDLLATPVAEDVLSTSGPEAVAELVGTVGYGRRIAGFEIGIAAKVIDQRVSGDRSSTAAADLGLARNVGPFSFGVVAQNIGPGLTINDAQLPLPFKLGFGASTDVRPLGPLDVAASAAVYRLHDAAIAAGGGIEVAWWPIVGRTFTARLGVRREPYGGTAQMTAGAAFTGDNVTIEYAFQNLDASGSTHRVGVRWR